MDDEWGGLPVKTKKKKGGASAINTPDAMSRTASGDGEPAGAKGRKKKGKK